MTAASRNMTALKQHFFDLRRTDAKSRRLEHVVAPPNEVEKTIFIHLDQITRIADPFLSPRARGEMGAVEVPSPSIPVDPNSP